MTPVRPLATALVVFMCACVCSASAMQGASPQALFDDGDFARARAAGQQEDSPAALAVACEAGLLLASYVQSGEEAVRSLDRALTDCARSIAKGRTEADAYVHYAVGVALEAKLSGSRRYAVGSRRLLEEAVARFPESGLAHGALAAWHASVSEEGLVVRKLLGANRESAREGFATSMRLDPANAAIAYERFRFLASGDSAERAEAGRIAEKADRAGASAAGVDRILQDRVAIVGTALREGRRKPVEAAMKATEAFAGAPRKRPADAFEPPFLEDFPSPEHSAAN